MASKMCPAVCRLGVNYPLTGPLFFCIRVRSASAHSVDLSQQEILVADTQYFVKMLGEYTQISGLLPLGSSVRRRGGGGIKATAEER